ncbi:hypothetical protein D3C87_488090 [compost metagenome]
MLNESEFKESIKSKYVTEYGARIGEVFCHIFDRNMQIEAIDIFFEVAQKFDFFDSEKFDQRYLLEANLIDSRNAMISSIIKEVKYDEHFMSWDEGSSFLDLFLREFNEIEKVYTNANWAKSTSKNSYVNELDMMGWSGFSKYCYYDYGFIIVTEKKIGILWFGDES